VLVIRPDDLGDLVLASPALARLRAALPDAHLALAIGPWGRPLTRHLPAVDEVIEIPFTGVSRASRHTRLGPYTLLWRAARDLRSRRFDVALVLRPDHWWGALLVNLAGVPRRIGFDVPEVAPFLTDVLPVAPPRHATDLNLTLVDRLTGSAVPRTPATAPLVFRIDDRDRRQAVALMDGLAGDRRRIVIHPGAGNPIKQWPVERWVSVATRLAADGATLLVTGSPGEADLAAPIAAAVGPEQGRNLTGQTDLGTLAAVFAASDLVLGVDSGALHVATAVAPRTLRLYGPSDPVMFGPWGVPERHQALWAGLRCPLCHVLNRATVCEPDCMGALTGDHVIAATCRLLAVPAPGQRHQ
jgi:lipopolysaccharide heptosyltransferase II